MAALQTFAVARREPGEGQHDQGLRIEHFGVQPEANRLVQQTLCSHGVAAVVGHHGQVLYPADGGRRQGGRHLVGLQRFVEPPQLKLGAAHHVVGICVVRIFSQQLFQGGGGLVDLTGVQLGTGNPQFGPRQGLGGDHGLVEGLRFLRAGQAQ